MQIDARLVKLYVAQSNSEAPEVPEKTVVVAVPHNSCHSSFGSGKLNIAMRLLFAYSW